MLQPVEHTIRALAVAHSMSCRRGGSRARSRSSTPLATACASRSAKGVRPGNSTGRDGPSGSGPIVYQNGGIIADCQMIDITGVVGRSAHCLVELSEIAGTDRLDGGDIAMSVTTSWKTALSGAASRGLGPRNRHLRDSARAAAAGAHRRKAVRRDPLRRGVYGQRYDNGQRHDGVQRANVVLPRAAAPRGPARCGTRRA